MDKVYDLIIIGSGPAGLTAGIYASRYNLKFLIIGVLNGGAISEAHKVCNYPSKNNISGFQLTQDIISHVKELDGEIKQEEVLSIERNSNLFVIKTRKNEYHSKKIILATGTKKQKLDIPGEDEFLGRGVSYCATCDGAFYKDKVVAVVGGGNAAVTAAILLSEHARKVYIIYRKEKFFRAEPAWLKQLEKETKIEPLFKKNITEIYGDSFVEGLKLDDGSKLDVDGVFIEVGSIPHNELAKELGIETSEGYIVVDKKNKTNQRGIFAAGDVTNNVLKQVITSASEGAIAATSSYEEIKLEE